MSKLLKIFGSLLLIILFSFLLKSNIQIYNLIGIIGIYISVYSLIIYNTKELDDFKYEEIITILISFMLQKAQFLLYKNVYKNKIFLMVNIIMIFLFLSLFVYKLFKNKKISLKNLWDLLYDFLVISLPFFLIIGSKFGIVISIICFVQTIQKKEYILDKNLKIIYLSMFCLFLFSLTSFIGNGFESSQLKMFRRFSENLIFLALFMQMKFSKIQIKKIISVGISASIIPIIPVMIQFLKIKSFAYRYGEDNPNTWALEAALWTVIFLYIVFFKNKKEYLPFYLLYVFTTILSGSKGPILAMIIVNILMFVYKYKSQTKMLIIIFLSAILIGCGILKTNNRISYSINLIRKEKKIDSSSATRLVIYKEAIAQFKDKPINGFGFDGYKYNSIKRNLENNNKKLTYIEKAGYSQQHAHNNILNYLCTTGILGTLSYLSMLFFILKKLYKGLRKFKYGILPIGLIFVYELCGLVDCTMFNGSQQRLMYFIVGISIAYITAENINKKV